MWGGGGGGGGGGYLGGGDGEEEREPGREKKLKGDLRGRDGGQIMVPPVYLMASLLLTDPLQRPSYLVMGIKVMTLPPDLAKSSLQSRLLLSSAPCLAPSSPSLSPASFLW